MDPEKKQEVVYKTLIEVFLPHNSQGVWCDSKSLNDPEYHESVVNMSDDTK